MRIILFVFSVLFALLTAGQLTAQTVQELGEYSEPITSLAPFKESGIALLTKKGEVMLISAEGKKEVVALPSRGKNEPADFCDLSLRGSTAYFIRSQEPKLFLLNLEKPAEGYKTIALKNFPSKLQVVGVCVTSDKIFITDTAYNVSSVEESGELNPLPAKSIAVPTPKDTTVQLIHSGGTDEKSLWKITLNGEKEFLTRASASKEEPLKNIRLIGFDKKDRLIFIDAVGRGIINNKYTVHAAKDGKISSSAPIEGPGRIVVARYHTLLGDDSVAFLRPGKTQPLRLLKITFP